MNGENVNEKPVTENKVNLKWGTREILGVKIENLQMTADKILEEVQITNKHKKDFLQKVRDTPQLYAQAIIDDTSDFHNFWGDEETHKDTQERRIVFLKQIAEHLLIYCNARDRAYE